MIHTSGIDSQGVMDGWKCLPPNQRLLRSAYDVNETAQGDGGSQELSWRRSG